MRTVGQFLNCDGQDENRWNYIDGLSFEPKDNYFENDSHRCFGNLFILNVKQ